jgi:PAS domain S-box-containing protein
MPHFPLTHRQPSEDRLEGLAAGLRIICAQDSVTAVLDHTVALALSLCGAASGRWIAPEADEACGGAAGPKFSGLFKQAIDSGRPVSHGDLICLPLHRPCRPAAAVLLEGVPAASAAQAGRDTGNDTGDDTGNDTGLDALLDVLTVAATAALAAAQLREELRCQGAIGQQAGAEAAFERNLLRTMVDHIPFRIYAKDRHSRFLFGNKRMARLAGVASPAELYGKTDYDFFPADLAAKYFADEMHLLASGESLLDHEEMVADQDAGELGWTLTTKVLLRDDAGEVNGIVGIGYDITPHKQMEARLRERSAALEQANATLKSEKEQQQHLIRKLSDMQVQLLQSEKMASIGLLAAGVAHEINNPLAFVSSNFSGLQRDTGRLLQLVSAFEEAEPLLPDSARAPLARLKREIDLEVIRLDLHDLLEESADGLRRVKQIVQDLKDFSRASDATWEICNLEHGLDSTLNVAWNEIKYKAEVIKEYAGVPDVNCLPSQINQVFLNLLTNAAHAIEGYGTIVLRTRWDEGHVWVEVADNGVGIAQEHLDRLYEPFFTTKPPGKGTGLGLSIVYGIVHKHGGVIEVDSVPGKGTTFRLGLPRDLARPSAAAG